MNQDLSILFSMQSMIVFLLVLSRISGMLSSAPLISTFPVPPMAKAGLAALTAFIIYPYVLKASHFPVPHDLITLAILVFKELLIGILIGFCAELIFVGIQIGGQLLSIQMGLSIANAIDPVTRQNVPVVGQFYLYAASLIFITLNGHQWLFSTVLDSYHSIPIGLDFSFTADLVNKIIFYTSQLFNIAFAIIMPIFGMLFLIDIALAFASKMMPQMNIFMVSLPLKIYIGLLFMSLFMTTTAVYLSGLIQNMLDSFRTLFM